MGILSLKNISYSYNKSYEKILKDISIEFEEGKFYAIIGKSGSGKSTLLSLLAGLDEPTKGEILKIKDIVIIEGKIYHLFSKIIIL